MIARRSFAAVIIGGGLLLSSPIPHAQTSPQQELIRAQELEKVKKQPAEAIEIYKKLVNSSDPKVAAAAREALERLGAATGAVRSQNSVVDRKVTTIEGFNATGISEDGRLAVGTSSAGDIEVRYLDTGEVHTAVPSSPAVTHLFPAVSRDGRFIAYGTMASTGAQPRAVGLFVIGTEKGATPRALIQRSSGPTILPAEWSADGSAILVSYGLGANDGTSRQVAQKFDWVSVPDGAIRTVKQFERPATGGGLSVSPDGKWIAYSVAPEKPLTQLDMMVRVMSEDGKADEAVVTMAGSNRQPKWSADGKHLFFIGDREGSGLWTVPVEHGRPVGEPAMLRPGMQRGLLGVTRSGGLYYARAVGNEPTTLVVDRSSTRHNVLQTFIGDRPVLSPDGRSVAFIRYLSPRDGARGRPYELTVRSLTTGEERGYSRPGLDRHAPIRWKADGNGLVVFVMDESGTTSGGGFYELDLKTASYRQFIPRDNAGRRRANSAALTSDGKTMFMLALRESGAVTHVLAIDAATGTERTVVAFPIPGLPGMAVAGPQGEAGPVITLSPDGKLLSLLSIETAAQSRLYLIATDGSGYREVPLPPAGMMTGSPQWMADSKSVVVGLANQPETLAVRIAADGSAPQRFEVDLLPLARRDPLRGFDVASGRGVSFSRDGERLALGLNSRPAIEFWSLENVAALIK